MTYTSHSNSIFSNRTRKYFYYIHQDIHSQLKRLSILNLYFLFSPFALVSYTLHLEYQFDTLLTLGLRPWQKVVQQTFISGLMKQKKILPAFCFPHEWYRMMQCRTNTIDLQYSIYITISFNDPLDSSPLLQQKWFIIIFVLIYECMCVVCVCIIHNSLHSKFTSLTQVLHYTIVW